MTTFTALEWVNNSSRRMVTPKGDGSYAHSWHDLTTNGVDRDGNIQVVGEGVGAVNTGANRQSIASPTSAGQIRFETIAKPDPELPDTFVALAFVISSLSTQYLSTRPMNHTHARSYFGTDATFGSDNGRASKIVYPEAYIDAQGFTGAGYVPTATYHYEPLYSRPRDVFGATGSGVGVNYRYPYADYFDPRPAAVVLQLIHAYNGRPVFQKYNTSSQFVFTGSPLSTERASIPVLMAYQDSKLLMASAPSPVKTNVNFTNTTASISPGTFTYRRVVDGAEGEGVPHYVTRSYTWRDVTSYPSIGDAVDLMIGDDDPPVLLGYGILVSCEWGISHATSAKGYTVQLPDQFIDTAYTVSDATVRQIYRDAMGDTIT